MSCITGEKFGKFLTDRTEYIDEQILEDWYPTEDAWVGHVSTGKWQSYDGNEHIFDRFHMAYPDLTGARASLSSASCVGTPCDKTYKKVGYGMTRKTYGLGEESYESDLICWDQNLTIWQAKEKWAMFVAGLRSVTKTINSNRLKVEALKGSETLYLAGAAAATAAVSLSADETVLDTGGVYPTSKLTNPYLQRFVEPLQLKGYFQKKTVSMPKFKLITDMTTSYDLVQGNQALAALFRFEDFQKGGQLYTYGSTSGIGNFMFSVDDTPIRFNKRASDGKLVRVYPYVNAAATVGIKQELSDAYQNAEIQWSPIWHPAAMKLEVLEGKALNPEMPFMVRDFAGKWKFAMDNLVVQGEPVDNRLRNKGLWFANFTSATKYERPELTRGILHLREPACVVNVQRCNAADAYTTQNTSSANTPCTSVFDFDVGTRDCYQITEVTCNGVPLDGVTANSLASAAAIVTSLTTNAPELGTWSNPSGTIVRLSGSACGCVTLTTALGTGC